MACDLIHTYNQKKQFLSILAGGVFLFAYLTQIYFGKLGYIQQQPVLRIIILALLIASTSALLYLIYYVVLSKFNKPVKSIRHIENNTLTIPISELFGICDDLSKQLHNLIEGLLPLPDFESDYIDESILQISRSRLVPCTAYSYGIITLCMSIKDSMYFQSNENKALQSYVLNNMLRITKETNEAMGLGNESNEVISNIVSRDIKHMIHCIDFYKTTNDNNPLAKFIIFLGKRISKDLLRCPSPILSFTQDRINKTTLLINKL